MNRFAFVGYYGMSNYGDDLFALVSSLFVDKYVASGKSVLFCPYLNGIDANYTCPSFVGSRAYQRQDYIGKFIRFSSLLLGSVTVDRVFFAGGSTFYSGKFDSRSLLFSLNKSKKNFFSAIGISVGPFDTVNDERKVVERLKRFEYISLRDSVSYDRVLSYGLDCKVECCADIVGALPLVANDINKTVDLDDSVHIGFSPCFSADYSFPDHRLCDYFIKHVLSLTDIDLCVDVICLNSNSSTGDIALCKYVSQELTKNGVKNNVLIYSDFGLVNTWKYIASLDFFVSARLHGAINAYIADVPFVLCEYHEKCTQFLDFIGKDVSQRFGADGLDFEMFSSAFSAAFLCGSLCAMSVEDYSALGCRNFTESPLVK